MRKKAYQHDLMNAFWYKIHPIRWVLYPFALIYQGISQLRRFMLEHFFQTTFDIPIIVVGNITVGGVGKTPLVIALAKAFQSRGIRVGIVSRGYGGTICSFPHEVSLTDDAHLVGDEPLLLCQTTEVPVVIAPKRVEAIRYLLQHHGVQVIISDDGLQHYAMGRAVEMVVIDGQRGVGNGLCLPAGPLREKASRLQHVDFLIVNGAAEYPRAHRMDLFPTQCIHLKSGQAMALNTLPSPLAAVAGIGNPQRFFDTLAMLNVSFKPYSFADHHQYQPNDLCFKEKAIIMTQKDAVKCRSFATDSMYYLPVNAALNSTFWEAFWSHKHLQGLAS